MSDGGARRDGQLPSIRSLTGGNPSKAAAPQQPRESQQQQTQPPMHENPHYPPYSQNYSHQPRHNDHAYHSTAYSPAQSKHQSPPYSQNRQQPGPGPGPASSSYERRLHNRLPPAREYPSTYSSHQHTYQRSHQPEGYAYHVSEPTHAKSTDSASHRQDSEHYRTAYGGEPTHYEGSHSMPASRDHYRQPLPQPHQRSQYQSEHPSLVGAREGTLDAAGMARSHSHYHTQYQPHYAHYSQPAAPHASLPHHQASHRREQEQDRRLLHTSAAIHSPEYQYNVPPLHYASYGAPSSQRATTSSDSAYPKNRGHQHQPPQPSSVAMHSSHQSRQHSITGSPHHVTAHSMAGSSSGVIRAPVPAMSEAQLLSTIHRTSSMIQTQADTASVPPLDNDNDDDDDDDDKSDDLGNVGVDEALLKRRKRNAQSAARLRERRKNREQELTGSCTKLESKISRLESELNEEKRRAIAEMRGGKSSARFPQESHDPGLLVSTNKHGELYAVGIKRSHPEDMDVEGELHIGNRSTNDVSMEGSSKKVRPLRELDQVRLDDLKMKIENLGALNQQVCVNLGVLRQEIQRIAEAIVSQKK
ncbi:hypothetical protein COEREDRAFT_93376 [Coemansia reversa NRRL 1564]|uniref:BZIP domain-containing protein n=1 Tax=Coemansia reversa (strain ATCC 12441 / NRRL 1564) TaxID=763665 RepID=A0A2G5B8U2_COERN|nr:hypothetical protein COEREDRAFT_93376 [Coemansia reversa NRRL 1564]|eukprot:PIA15147.1 hypothetical protein COEREDRAFT_93376 [Coemansia reversa NRRL 1564]